MRTRRFLVGGSALPSPSKVEPDAVGVLSGKRGSEGPAPRCGELEAIESVSMRCIARAPQGEAVRGRVVLLTLSEYRARCSPLKQDSEPLQMRAAG